VRATLNIASISSPAQRAADYIRGKVVVEESNAATAAAVLEGRHAQGAERRGCFSAS
jgi:hypothetical protein